jgi:hypothetical protein
VQQAESLANALATSVAQHHKIDYKVPIWQGAAFGGLCAAFGPKTENQPMPPAFKNFDEDGEWENLGQRHSRFADLRPNGLDLPSDIELEEVDAEEIAPNVPGQ